VTCHTWPAAGVKLDIETLMSKGKKWDKEEAGLLPVSVSWRRGFGALIDYVKPLVIKIVMGFGGLLRFTSSVLECVHMETKKNKKKPLTLVIRSEILHSIMYLWCTF